MKPGYAEAWHNLGHAYIEASKLLNVGALGLHVGGQTSLANKLGDTDAINENAVEALDKAVGLRPDIPEMHNTRALALVGLRRYEEALEAVSRALELNPSYAKAAENLAHIERWVAEATAKEEPSQRKRRANTSHDG